MTKSRFDIEYNKWLQQVDVEEDDAVWNEIRDELDFIETWDNISTKLDKVKPQKGKVIPMKYLKVFAAAAAIILILFLPVRYFVEQASHPVTISELSEEADEKEELTSDKPTTSATIEEDAEIAQKAGIEVSPADKVYKKPLESFYNNELTPIIESKESVGTVFSNEEPALHRIQNLPFDANILLAGSDAILSNSIETEFHIIPKPGKSSDFSFRVVEVGLVYGYKNTWLLNYETRNGLDPEKLGNTLPTFHRDIGVSSSLELNKRHLFGLEFLWKSETGQNYQQYINASFVDKNINLDYLKLQAFYLWENDIIPGQAIFGGYIARLTMAEEWHDKTRFNVDDSYSDLDYGLLTGYQFNIALKDRIIIKPGLRVSYNLVNIFEGDDITPSHFKRTKNLSASFNISLSYRFNK